MWTSFRRAGMSLMNRGESMAATRIVRGNESRQRRGNASGNAADATRIFFFLPFFGPGEESRRRIGEAECDAAAAAFVCCHEYKRT